MFAKKKKIKLQTAIDRLKKFFKGIRCREFLKEKFFEDLKCGLKNQTTIVDLKNKKRTFNRKFKKIYIKGSTGLVWIF